MKNMDENPASSAGRPKQRVQGDPRGRGVRPTVSSRPASSLRIPLLTGNYPGMTFYRRRLPHVHVADQPVFLTWRLHDTLPSHRTFPKDALNSGQAFAAMDRLLDEVAVESSTCANQPSRT